MKRIVRKSGWVQSSIIMGLLFAEILFFASASVAQNETPPANVGDLTTSINDVLNNELKKINDLKDRLGQVTQQKATVLTAINAYKIQLPIYNNLLLQSETTRVEDIEKAWLEIQSHMQDVDAKISDLETKQAGITPQLDQTREQLASTEKQVVEILSDITIKKQTADVSSRFKKLVTVLKEKERTFKKINALYDDMLASLGEIRKNFNDLSDKLNETISRKKKQTLLERQNFLISIGAKRIIDDAKSMMDQLLLATTGNFWTTQINFIRTAGYIFLISFALLFSIVLYLAWRIRKYLVSIQGHPRLVGRFYSRLALRMLQRSLFLLFVTLFVYVYDQTGPFRSKTPLTSIILNLLAIWLFTQWGLDAVRQYTGKAAVMASEKPAFYLRSLIQGSRWISMIYETLSWLGGASSSILIVCRVIFEASLYAWNIFFWKDIWRRLETRSLSPKGKAGVTSVKSITFAIILIASILELAGFGMLALYWLASWAKTLIVLLWSGIGFMVLREWNPKANRSEPEDEIAGTSKDSLSWVAVQLSLLSWLTGLVIFLVFAWGGKQAVLLGIFNFLQHTFQVGSMRFSLIGFIVATLIILMTQAFSRIWRQVFRKKILHQSGMDEGLQDSVVTISVYVIWSAGILFALNAVGFTATSLTVILGALGVGLGFGLQAIFNNFISGIILLFERPIQVGDDIEVGGIWARVKEINVRSTIVQTYDNASLIIPNSDLITSQVTNWSFKDKRIRRNVEVGVAYGSDVELVRATLQEAAENTSRVLKLPKPDVIFKNFGDSTLVFLLRFWTRLEYFLAVESDVRFEIDRLFRERDIEMAFPQYDIHIRSGLNSPNGEA